MGSTSFRQLTGNARGCLVYEPLFLIPYSMFTTYTSIYMYQLGVTETGIGWITSIGLLVQVLSSFLSGYLTDRLGRKSAAVLRRTKLDRGYAALGGLAELLVL